MCCFHHPELAKEFLSACKDQKWIVAYKVLSVCRGKDNKRYLLSKHQPNVNKPWKVGIYESNSSARCLSKRQVSIHRGIHVYLSKEYALSIKHGFFDTVVLAVKCQLADLIGVDLGHAVFKKVTVTKAKFAAAMRQREQREVCEEMDV